MWESILGSLLSPMVLAFVLGIIATRLGSDLKIPEQIYLFLTIYLMMAIGLKGGYKLSQTALADIALPALAAVGLSLSIPVWCYYLLRHLGRFDIQNAAAIAAHYGSVSAVTFSAAITYLDNHAPAIASTGNLPLAATAAIGTQYEGYMPGLLAIMEVPAILIAIYLARRAERGQAQTSSEPQASAREIMRELLAGRSSILLLGFLIIGLLVGKDGYQQVAPLFDTPFRGFLTIFLLEAGLVTGRRLGELRKVGLFLVGFGMLMPPIHAIIGILLGHAVGLSLGGCTVLGVLAASASYIAAPAACRVALPKSSPSYALTAALAITFPFNIVLGLPLYHQLATWLYS